MKILKNGDKAFFQPKNMVLVALGIGFILYLVASYFVISQDRKLLPVMMIMAIVMFVMITAAIVFLDKVFSWQRFIVSSQGIQFPGKGKVCLSWDQIKTIRYKERKTHINGITRQSELLVFETLQASTHEWDLTGISRQDRQLLFQLFAEHELAVKGLE